MSINIKPAMIKRFSSYLTDNERDNLKYKLSISAINEFNKIGYDHNPNKADYIKVNAILNSLIQIQPYQDRIPEYGIVYRGRPEFITNELLEKLCLESEKLRFKAQLNLDQFIARVETPTNSTVCEIFAESEELYEFVNRLAGPVVRSYVTSYIYYDEEGHCSRPHVDNAFTSVTVMMGLKQEGNEHSKLSSSFVCWPNKPPLEYRLKPGEISIFFGACVLHGRSAIGKEENTCLLLMSFRPNVGSK